MPSPILPYLEHVQQLKADAHPLSGGHKAGAPVCDTPHKVNAVFLQENGTVLNKEVSLQGMGGKAGWGVPAPQ